MKFLFVQLPLTDHAQSYIQGNIEYAPATIAAYIKRRIEAQVAIEFLPFNISNFASNSVILHYITSLNPDVICFSNYLWNLERHLHLAEKIKKSLPHVHIIFGGPEIAPGSHVFSEPRPYVDYFVNGEGEWFFRHYFNEIFHKTHAQNFSGNTPVTQPFDELLPAHEIVEPFTAQYLNPMPDGSIFLEMTRGCPYRCSYCYYSKNTRTVREQPHEILLTALQDRSRRLNEIYILSPTFNRTSRFMETLHTIQMHNPGIRLHTEMRAEGIDKKMAIAIRQAGFESLEIGLQTLTRKALVSVTRCANPDQELKGMQHLRDAGIELKIGIIPGLPEDSPSEFMKTVETLVRSGFGEYLELYPLMILPGTRMRDIARARNASFMQKPPYFFLEGWGFRHNDLAAIYRFTEEMTGFTADVENLPDFSLTEKGFLTASLYINCLTFPHWHTLDITHYIQTSVFTIHLSLRTSSLNIETLKDFLCRLPLEDQLYSIVLYSDHPIDNAALNTGNHQQKDSYHVRTHCLSDMPEKSHFRFFQVFENFSTYTTAREVYSTIIPIIKIHKDNVRIINFLTDEEDHLLISKEVYRSIRRQLLHAFPNAVECIAFESAEDMEDFYDAVHKEFFRVEGLKLTYARL